MHTGEPPSPTLLLSREGNLLIVSHGARLPPRCFRCNQPATQSKLYKLSWHKSWLWLLAVVNPPLYFVVAPFVRESIRIEAWLCDQHRSRRARGWIGVGGGLLVGAALLGTGIWVNDPGLMGMGGLALIAGLATWVVLLRLWVPQAIQDGKGRIGGCGGEFLDSLDGESSPPGT